VDSSAARAGRYHGDGRDRQLVARHRDDGDRSLLPSPATCAPGTEIHKNLVGAVIATAVFFSALLIPLQHRKWQPLRRALQAATLLSATWPAIWIVLFGGPTL
jgi:hypothetical protein